jgi:hypothetical protein
MCFSTREASCVLRALGSPQTKLPQFTASEKHARKQRSPKSSPRAKSPPFLLEGVPMPSGIEAKGRRTESSLNLTAAIYRTKKYNKKVAPTTNHHRHHRHRVVVGSRPVSSCSRSGDADTNQHTEDGASIHGHSLASVHHQSTEEFPTTPSCETTNDCCCVATGARPIRSIRSGSQAI